MRSVPHGWPFMPIAEAAKIVGQSARNMKRWLTVRVEFEPRLLVHFTPPGKHVRKWWVNRDALCRVLGVEQKEFDAIIKRHENTLDNHEWRIKRLERCRPSSTIVGQKQPRI